jgi:hypothetical protein
LNVMRFNFFNDGYGFTMDRIQKLRWNEWVKVLVSYSICRTIFFLYMRWNRYNNLRGNNWFPLQLFHCVYLHLHCYEL